MDCRLPDAWPGPERPGGAGCLAAPPVADRFPRGLHGVTFAHPLPWWALLLAVAGALVVAWTTYRRLADSPARRVVLSSLRLLTLLVLLLFLMRPVIQGRPADREAIVPVLVDASRSMGLQDADGLRRIDRARQIVDAALGPALGDRFRLDVLSFGDGLAEAAGEELVATAPRSDLSGALTALAERYRGQVVAGAIVLSDGGDTSAAAEQVAARVGVPLFPIGLGADRMPGDREVLSVTSAESVMEGAQVDIAVSAVAHVADRGAIELRLLENGNAQQIARVTPAAPGAPVHHVFRVSPAPGVSTVYAVETPTPADDPVPENNRRSVLVDGAPRPRRVLLVEGAPGFEHSFLKRAWAGDSGLDVDAVLRKGSDERGRDTYYVQAARSRADGLTTGYPASAAALFVYDAVVLANVEANRLSATQLQWTRDFVARRGGGLMVLGGRTFVRPGLGGTPLEDLVPLYLDDRADALPAARVSGANRPALTAAGLDHPVTRLGLDDEETTRTWESLPALAGVAALGGPRPGASVLAVAVTPGGITRALTAVQRYGEGRTLAFTGEGAWRWRMQRPAADRAYDTFWRQALRWIAAPAADAVHLTVPPDAAAGAAATLAVSVRDASFEPVRSAVVDLRVSRPDGGVDEVRAAPSAEGSDVYTASYRPAAAGIYRLEAAVSGGATGQARTSLLVGGADLEMTDPRRHHDLLQRVAVASGGRVIEVGDLAGLVTALEARVPAATTAASRDLWHTGWSFTLVIGLLAAEWLLRRRWGLR